MYISFHMDDKNLKEDAGGISWLFSVEVSQYDYTRRFKKVNIELFTEKDNFDFFSEGKDSITRIEGPLYYVAELNKYHGIEKMDELARITELALTALWNDMNWPLADLNSIKGRLKEQNYVYKVSEYANRKGERLTIYADIMLGNFGIYFELVSKEHDYRTKVFSGKLLLFLLMDGFFGEIKLKDNVFEVYDLKRNLILIVALSDGLICLPNGELCTEEKFISANPILNLAYSLIDTKYPLYEAVFEIMLSQESWLKPLRR